MSDNKTRQCDMILAHLKRYGWINDDIARRDYGCKRLPSRISDLRANGYSIATIKKTAVNRFGKKVTFADRYTMRSE